MTRLPRTPPLWTLQGLLEDFDVAPDAAKLDAINVAVDSLDDWLERVYRHHIDDVPPAPLTKLEEDARAIAEKAGYQWDVLAPKFRMEYRKHARDDAVSAAAGRAAQDRTEAVPPLRPADDPGGDPQDTTR